LINFLYQKLGEPELVVQNLIANKLSEYKDILVVDVDTWLDASGHAVFGLVQDVQIAVTFRTQKRLIYGN